MHVDVATYLTDSLRVALGATFVVAVVPKFLSPRGFYRDVTAYRVVPRSIAPMATAMLLAAEAFLGLCLVLGWLLDLAMPLATATFAAFTVAVALNLLRRNRVRCGCFGSASEVISANSLLRLALLVSGAGLLTSLRLGAVVRSQPLQSMGVSGAGGATYIVATFSTAAAFLILARWFLNAAALATVVREALELERQSPTDSAKGTA
jgi:hypothetical protein